MPNYKIHGEKEPINETARFCLAFKEAEKEVKSRGFKSLGGRDFGYGWNKAVKYHPRFLQLERENARLRGLLYDQSK